MMKKNGVTRRNKNVVKSNNAKHGKSGIGAYLSNNLKYFLAAIAVVIAIIAVFFGESKFLVSNTETITLEFKQKAYLNVGTGERFFSLSQAVIDATEDSPTGKSQIRVLGNKTETNAVTIPVGKEIELDLNGNTVSLDGVSITNNGTLEIIDTDENVAGAIVGLDKETLPSADTIVNSGTMSVDNGVTIRNNATDLGKSVTYSAVNNAGTLTVTNGNIEAEDIGLSNNGTATILSGSVVSENTAIFNHATGILTVGSYDENNLQNEVTSTVDPEIVGAVYGVVNDKEIEILEEIEGTFNYYDGTIIGKNNRGSAISGTITNTPEGYGAQRITVLNQETEEYIETSTLVIANYGEYDATTGNLMSVYTNLKDSMEYSDSGNTIKVLQNVTDASSASPTVASGKTLTLDLDTYTITMVQSITNNGTLTVQGTATGTITNATNNVINSAGTTTILSGNITATSATAINQTAGTVTIGDNTTAIDRTTPTITGATNGVLVTAGTFNFYDGTIIGQNGEGSAVNGTIANRATNSQLSTTLDNTTETTTLLNIYTVQFNANGGTGNMASQTVVENTPLTLRANSFTKDNLFFNGWNTEANGSGQSYEDEQTVTNIGNVTLYAQWTSEIRVTYNSGDGSFTNGNTNVVIYNVAQGDSIVLQNYSGTYEEPTLTGYEFIGWNTKADGTGIYFEDEASISLNKATVLYAQYVEFREEEVDYEFDYTGAVQTQTLQPGEYKLEVWGAQGGQGANGTTTVAGGSSSTAVPGKGGYSVGTINLDRETTVFCYVGGQRR